MFNYGGSGIINKENHLITRRRAEEARKSYYNGFLQADAKDRFFAKWENNTGDRIDNKKVMKELERLKRQAHAQLEARRDRLAAKLAEEDRRYRIELRESQETPEQRRGKIMEKAQALKERREKRDRDLADHQLYRKFVRDCDELREAKSRAKVLDYMQFRSAQVAEKKQIEDQERKIDQYFDNEWAKMKAAGDAREAREQADADRKREQLNRFLEEQIEDRDIALAEEKKREEREAQLHREQWDIERQQDEAAARARVEKAWEIQRETNEYNKRKQAIRDEDARREKELDDKLLAEVLAAESEKKKAEEEHKKKLKEQAKRYQELLKEQMKKEAADESHLEAKRQEEIDRQWKKRQDQWDREQNARDRLMAEVQSSRQQQLEARKIARQREREEAEADRFRLQEQLKKRAELEQQEALEKKRLDAEHQDFLRKQMAAKKQTREAIFQMQRAQQKAEIEARQAYERALKRELAALENNKPTGYKHVPIAKNTRTLF